MWEEKLAIYDEIVAKCQRFERKGKTTPYTSANGYMFSLLNKDGEIGIRFSEQIKKAYIQKYDTKIFQILRGNDAWLYSNNGENVRES